MKELLCQNPKIEIILGDSLVEFKKFEDGFFDCIIADPPYNVGQKFPNDNLSKIEYLKFMEKWIIEAYRTLKDGGSFYMFHYFLGMWDIKPILDKFKWSFLNLIIWSYSNLLPSNKTLRYRYPLSYQPIFYYGKNFKKDLVGKLYNEKVDERKDVWLKTATQSNFKKEYRWHPSCKLLSVITKIMKGATEPGDLILDPFMGSGTTGVVAKQLNRNFMGIEIEKKYFDVAVKRIMNTQKSLL